MAVSACSGPGAIDPAVTRYGLRPEWRTGAPFDHLIVSNVSNVSAARDVDLRVYIDGDGVPFVTPSRVAQDPTPRKSLMMRLMAQDPNPAIFVSRPCYYSAGHDSAQPLCADPRTWTTGRYGEAVVRSMAAAIAAAGRARGYRAITLIGHSGGGTLAVLIAARLPAVRRVVTLSGNLDPERWAAHHGYSPLTDSLSPLSARLAPEVVEFHVVALSDKVVPPSVAARYLEDEARARRGYYVCELPRCGHENCVKKRWKAAAEWLHEPARSCAELQAGR